MVVILLQMKVLGPALGPALGDAKAVATAME